MGTPTLTETLGTATTSVVTMMEAANRSLSVGSGPDLDENWRCPSTDPLGLPCHGSVGATGGYPSSSVRSRAGSTDVHSSASVGPSWFNETLAMNGLAGGANYSVEEAAAAYDPLLQEVVLFGGCSSTECPSNQTWIYDGDAWFNDTAYAGVSPPAALGDALTWDPQFGGLILTGGVDSKANVVGYTWRFDHDGWENITASVGPYPGGGTAFAATAYDGALGELVMVDGCRNATCTSVWAREWTLDSTGWSSGSGPQPAGSPSLGQLWGSSMAYDPVDSELVLFGGITYFNNSTTNFTFILNGTGWHNVTGSAGSSCSSVCEYPRDRYGASMTWDGQIGAIVLSGGRSSEAGALNDTWYLSSNQWVEWASSAPAPGPPSAWEAAMPTNSSDIAPVEEGGRLPSGALLNTSWVFDVPPAPVITAVAPDPADVGAPVPITVTHSAGDGSGPLLADYVYENDTVLSTNVEENVSVSSSPTFGANATDSAPGDFNVYAGELDFFWVNGFSQNVRLEVVPAVTASHSVSPDPTEVGVSTSFTSGVALGTGDYSYTWSFGDGSPLSTSPTPTHRFATAANRTGWVNVTDTGGGWVNRTFEIVVDPLIAVSPIRSSTLSPETSTRVTFSATASGGIPGPGYSFAWSFDDGTPGAYGAEVSHTFSAAGSYSVRVVVTDSVGATATSSLNITVARVSSPSLLDGLTSGWNPYFLALVIVGTAALSVLNARPRKTRP